MPRIPLNILVTILPTMPLNPGMHWMWLWKSFGQSPPTILANRQLNPTSISAIWFWYDSRCASYSWVLNRIHPFCSCHKAGVGWKASILEGTWFNLHPPVSRVFTSSTNTRLRQWRSSVWGENIFSANYDTYKWHRRIVVPGFTSKMWDAVYYCWFPQSNASLIQVWSCVDWSNEDSSRDDGLRGMEFTEIILCPL
jgi:hypothetical protein